MEWQVNYYKTEDGESPIEEWLDSLNEKVRAKIFRNFDLLEQFALDLKEPYVKPLEDKLYEIRAKDTSGIYRIIYFSYTGKQFIMLNGFTKKTQKTPRKEIALAKQRMKEITDE
jgi:phage-related protein